ncbi:tetratricopeptide repeat protein, partial [Candidatus Woesearchaeota archaeon]|nr:tetratricopeptide repeat protein [Candidatus Woesearchaeota archaeon]
HENIINNSNENINNDNKKSILNSNNNPFDQPIVIESKKFNLKYTLIAIFIIIILITSITYNFIKENSTKQLIDDGWKLYNNGNYENSKIKFEKVIKKEPDNYKGYGGLGGSYFRLGNFEKAIENFEKVIELNPNNSNASRGLGYSYFFLEDYENAIESFEKGFELNPDDEKILEGLGKSYYEMKDYEKAIEIFEQSSTLNSTIKNNYVTLLNLYIKQNNFQKSFEIINKISEDFGENYETLNYLGYYYLSRFSENNLKFSKNMSLIKNNQNYWNDTKLAKKYFEKSILLNPNYANSYTGLGICYYRTGEFNLSKNNLKKAITIDIENELAYYYLSILYNRLYENKIEGYNKAKEILLQRINQKTKLNHCFIFIELGIVELNLGNIQESKKNLKKALEIESNCLAATELEYKLNQIK